MYTGETCATFDEIGGASATDTRISLPHAAAAMARVAMWPPACSCHGHAYVHVNVAGYIASHSFTQPATCSLSLVCQLVLQFDRDIAVSDSASLPSLARTATPARTTS